MYLIITTSKEEKKFTNRDFITIGGNEQFDFPLDLGFEYMLTVEYDAVSGKFTVLNNLIPDKYCLRGSL